MKQELTTYYLIVYNASMVQIACDWGNFRTEKQAYREAEKWMKRIGGKYCHVEVCYR